MHREAIRTAIMPPAMGIVYDKKVTVHQCMHKSCSTHKTKKKIRQKTQEMDLQVEVVAEAATLPMPRAPAV